MRTRSGRNSRMRGAWVIVAVMLLIQACAAGSGQSTTTSGAPASSTTGVSGSSTSTTQGVDEWLETRSLEELEKAAFEDGFVRWYSSMPAADAQRVFAEFLEDYPEMDGEVVQLSAGPLLETFLADYARGRVQADVASFSAVGAMLDAQEQGAIQPYVPSATENVLPNTRIAEPYGLASYLMPFPWMYREDLPEFVKEAFEAGDWSMFTDPQIAEALKGKISMADPALAGSALQAQVTLLEQFGEDEYWTWLEAFAALEPVFYESNVPAQEAITSGERAAGLVFEAIGVRAVEDGAAVRLVYLDPTPSSITLASLATDAPNPDGGKLFLHWLHSEPGQRALMNIYGSPPIVEGMTDERGHTAAAWFRPELMDPTRTRAASVEFTQGVSTEEFLERFAATFAK